MYPTGDTIVAVATPPGRGGVGLVRLSGEHAAAIALGLAGRTAPWPARHAVRARLTTATLRAEALITYFQAPRSYTGEDVVELSAHGSPVILAALIDEALARGARLAKPGEFTLRAFLNGKLDLVQAEAARDLVEAVSPAQVRAAFDQLDGTLSSALHAVATELRDLELRLEASMDFPDEGYHFIDRDDVGALLERLRSRLAALVDTGARGRLVRAGARIVMAGAPNAGKSSLFNALVGAERAIVSEWPGTTRDLVTARLVLGDDVIELVDTAGLRDTSDRVEQEGVRRAEQALDDADVVIAAVDRSRPRSDDDGALLARIDRGRAVLVATKADLAPAWLASDLDAEALTVSALSGEGVPALIERLVMRLRSGPAGTRDDVLITNQRHRVLLQSALSHLTHARDAFAASQGELPEEFVAADVQLALGALEDITGRRSPDALLDEIFAKFCIGK